MVTHRSSETGTAVSRVAAALATAAVGAAVHSDPDLWGHLRFGLDLLDTHALTSRDPYSFTQDVAWVNHEWLSELLYALIYRVGGVPALVVVKTLVIATVTSLLWPLTKRVNPWWRGGLLVVALIGIAPAAMSFRPQLWTLLGLAVLVRVLVDRRSPLWLAPLFALWVNLHGGWIVGGGVAALWVIGRAMDERRLTAIVPFVGPGVAALAATLINPYGWGMWTFLFATVRMGRDVTEWQPLWRQDSWGHAVVWAIAAAVVIGGLRRGWRMVTWRALLPVAWLAVSGLFVDRLSFLFCELSVLTTGLAWRDERPPTEAASQPIGRMVVDFVAVAVIWVILAVPQARCLTPDGAWAPDFAAAGALSNSDVKGRLVVPFDWGQYAIWHWGPRLRVSMDGRRETVYSDGMVQTNLAVVNGAPGGLAFLEQVRPEHVWLPASSTATARWLRTSGYRIDVETPASFIATRGDLPAVPAAPPASRCFP